MLTGEYFQRVESALEDPEELMALSDELAKDQDVGDRDRQAVQDRIAQYLGDARASDPDGVVDEPESEAA